MLSTHKSTTTVGLDIEAGSIAATEVVSNGAATIGRTGTAALAPGVTRDGEVSDSAALSEALKDLFAEQKLPRNVRVGLASQRVVVRTLRLPRIENHAELEAAIRFQAPDRIAMPLEQAVIDWQIVDPTPETIAAKQMDVVVVAARRNIVAGMTTALREAGLKPIGIDVSAFAMIRALAPELAQTTGATAASYEDRMSGGDEADLVPQASARLFCNLGDITNLAVARGSNCLFTRVASFGIEGIAQRLSERRELTLEHARQWLLHVGLEAPIESIEGDPDTVAAARETLIDGATKLAGELRLSLDYYGTQEGAVAIDEIVVCGTGTAIAGLPARLQSELGYALRVGRPEALGHLDEATAARLTVSYGLAMES